MEKKKWIPKAEHVPAKTTLEAMADRHLQNDWPIPAEIARPMEIQNPPKLDALKLLKLMMFKSGPLMAERNKTHTFYLSDINDHPGFKRHHTLKSVDLLCEELMQYIVTTREDIHFDKGVMLQYARSNSNKQGRVVISYIFGEKFIKLVEESTIFTLLDCTSVFYFENRYSMFVYDYVASFYKLKTKRNNKFTLTEFRKMCGIPKDKYPEFSEFKRRVIDPIFEDIALHVGNFSLTYETERTGKPVTHIILSWKENMPQQKMQYDAVHKHHNPPPLIHINSTKFYESFPNDIKDHANESWKEFCHSKLNITNYPHFHNLFKMYAKDMNISLYDPFIKNQISIFAKEHYDPEFSFVG